ncbi:VOC family protein [Halalkalibacter krulwichiae]|uniref:Fosfomycin resistance protein FosB n=1 Tax=Halalkalibacter krulwichiae TaxID=199441 RepID=A0A1X9MC24_9BACI|nr:VOC family protein [Halalkalibacter krulwichiae]ARK30194.1 fosfomycin resistance protein FosB [Halalkalibacter krulwichiae]
MFEIENIHHVSLSVTDLEKAKHFYGTQLGFNEIERPNFDFPGAWYQIGNQQLHLIVHQQSNTIRGDLPIESKDGHFAIRVKDYDETLVYLKKKGILVVEKPHSKSGFAQIFCADPDGNLIEFNVDQE